MCHVELFIDIFTVTADLDNPIGNKAAIFVPGVGAGKQYLSPCNHHSTQQ